MKNLWLILLVCPDWLLGQEEDGRAGSTPAHAAGAGAQPDAAADRRGHRALRCDQAGKREHGIVPLRARHYPDRLQDRAYRHRLQEDAGDPVAA